jgi:hypothetical protein
MLPGIYHLAWPRFHKLFTGPCFPRLREGQPCPFNSGPAGETDHLPPHLRPWCARLPPLYDYSIRLSPPNLPFPATKNGTTQRKGNSRLRAPFRLLACRRQPLRRALGQKMPGNAARPTHGQSPGEHRPMAKRVRVVLCGPKGQESIAQPRDYLTAGNLRTAPRARSAFRPYRRQLRTLRRLRNSLSYHFMNTNTEQRIVLVEDDPEPENFTCGSLSDCADHAEIVMQWYDRRFVGRVQK